jgi:hypothetical protein
MPSLSSERLRSLLGALLFAGLGAYVLGEAQGFSRRGAMLPYVVGYGMVGLSAVLALMVLVKPDRTRTGDGGSLARRWLFVVALGAWVALIPFLGFLLASVLGFSAVSFIVPREHPWTLRSVLAHVAAGALAAIAVYVLFAHYLSVPLPTGRLW